MTKQIDEVSKEYIYNKYMKPVSKLNRKELKDRGNSPDLALDKMSGKAKVKATGKDTPFKGNVKDKPFTEEVEMNENLENILVHAWNKDAVNLRDALDSEMQSRISDHVDSMVADVSARLFNPTLSNENEG
jgi:hypothetical protein